MPVFCAPCHLGLLLLRGRVPAIVPASSFPGPSPFFSVDANKKTDACFRTYAFGFAATQRMECQLSPALKEGKNRRHQGWWSEILIALVHFF
jgi:hypothetical protein